MCSGDVRHKTMATNLTTTVLGANKHLLLLFMACLLCITECTATLVQFDHYVLALSWPKSYCAIQKEAPLDERCHDASHVPQQFTIHGLWPSLSNGAKIQPSTCLKIEFSFDLMGSVVKANATNKWPDVRKSVNGKTSAKDSSPFWSEEWRKHGACSNLAQDNYMNLTMELYDEILPKIRQALGFPLPKFVDTAKFTKYFVNNFYIKPKLFCGNIKNPPTQLLHEIRFFVDKSNHFFDATGKSNCGTSVSFP